MISTVMYLIERHDHHSGTIALDQRSLTDEVFLTTLE